MDNNYQMRREVPWSSQRRTEHSGDSSFVWSLVVQVSHLEGYLPVSQLIKTKESYKKTLRGENQGPENSIENPVREK